MAITENLSNLRIHRLSQEQYENALANGNVDQTALYLTPDNSLDEIANLAVAFTARNVEVTDTAGELANYSIAIVKSTDTDNLTADNRITFVI